MYEGRAIWLAPQSFRNPGAVPFVYHRATPQPRRQTMDIGIGMKRAGITKLRDELTEALEGGEHIDVTFYARNNNNTSQEVTVQINNDDMERPEVGDDEAYVEITP